MSKVFPDQVRIGSVMGETLDVWSQNVESQLAPPIDTFVEGWVSNGYPANFLPDVLALGTVHAACSIGPETPTINGVAFEQSSANTGDTNLPNNTTGWTGTNWQLLRGDRSLSPPTIGNNTARLETTAFPDLPDASFGTIPGFDQLCQSSLLRNCAVRFSNLTIGANYYAVFCFFCHPEARRAATIITPDDGLQTSDTFGVDGTGWILSSGLRRYGWTATSTDIEFIKYGYDTAFSYFSGFACIQV